MYSGQQGEQLPLDFAHRSLRARIIVTITNLRVNRFNRLLLFIGYGSADIASSKIHQFCKTLHVFAVEYRTEREKILQRRQKANQPERKASLGKIPDYVSIVVVFDNVCQPHNSD